MKVTLFDGVGHEQLKPFTFTRPVADLRVGILTIQEKWNKFLNTECRVRTKDYLTARFDGFDAGGSIGVSAILLPNEPVVKAIKKLEEEQLLMSKEGAVLAINPLPETAADFEEVLTQYEVVEYKGTANLVQHPWDIFRLNGAEIKSDFNLIKDTITPQQISASNRQLGEHILVEEGAKVEMSILNASDGPIYIAKGAEVMEGSIIRGPFALLEGGVVKLGTKIYGPTTVGPYSKVGGELNNCVFQGYSNKGHDGFLGNSVIGQWCNLGADTNSSNLKNNYGEVKVWNYKEEGAIASGQQFCGLLMGDHSKCGINTMFNTGTVVGVNANIYGGDFPPKFIPSYAWGGADGFTTYDLDKSFEVAERVMSRRSVDLSEDDKAILRQVHDQTDKFRNW